MADQRVWSSRKLVSAWALTWVFTALLGFDKLTPDAYSTCVSFIWIGYFAGNVGDRWVGRKNSDN